MSLIVLNLQYPTANVLIETERLTLRSLQIEDCSDFYEFARVEEVGLSAGWNPHTSIEDTEQIVKRFCETKDHLSLVDKHTGKMIGFIHVKPITIYLTDEDLKGKEIAYSLSKDYWGLGLMPEALKSLIAYYFRETDLDYFQISHALSNIQSRKVIEKCGFVYNSDNLRTTANGDTHYSKFYLLYRC